MARLSRERGDDLVAIVRDRRRADALVELGAEIIEDDLSDVGRLTEALHDADAVIHAAGSYRVGITKAERGAMWDANVGTTTRLLDAAEAAKTPRIVYVSTVNVFGNTNGRIVDETYRRDLADGFLSWYDETKYGAHEVAEQRIAGGAPIVVVLPSQVYGPGDHSSLGEQLARRPRGQAPVSSPRRRRHRLRPRRRPRRGHRRRARSGRDRPPVRPVRPDDDAGRSDRDRGEDRRTQAARPPTSRRASSGRSRRSGRLIGQANLREVIAAAAGVTYWASAARAETELGFQTTIDRGRPPRHVRPRLTTLDPMARELPMFEPAGGGHHGSASPETIAMGGSGHARCGATPTGSRPGCRRARTTTTSRACCAA